MPVPTAAECVLDVIIHTYIHTQMPLPTAAERVLDVIIHTYIHTYTDACTNSC